MRNVPLPSALASPHKSPPRPPRPRAHPAHPAPAPTTRTCADQDTGGFFVALLRKRRPLYPTGEATDAPADKALPSTGPAGCRQLPEPYNSRE